MPAMRARVAGSLWISGSLVVFGSLLGLLACRPSRESAPDPHPPSPKAVASTEVVIVYELTGGFAGFDLTLTVRQEPGTAPEGAAVVMEKGREVRVGSLSPGDWAGLEQLLAAADLGQIRPSYGKEGAVSDAMQEVVTVRRAGAEVRVSAISDPGDEPPAEFRVLTVRLRELALTLPSR